MAYDGKILRRAREVLEADRETRRAQLEQRRTELYRKQPRLREVETRLRSTTPRIIAAAMRKGIDPRPELEKLRAENLGLQAEKREILARLRLPPDYLDDTPACARCREAGFLPDGQMCPECLGKYYAREQRRELSSLLDLNGQTFENFSLTWYSDRYDVSMDSSPRSVMCEILERCKEYAYDFGTGMENLLLYGPPGLGKTFLSAAIAQVVVRRGFSVVYNSAGRVFGQFEDHHFHDADDEPVNRVLNCDLLILDDLGTELTTAFTQTVLYQIINTRLTDRRSSIINTNLKPEELTRRYSVQIVSRLRGNYEFHPFFGEDIRIQKHQKESGDETE